MRLHERVANWIPAVGGRRFILTVGSGFVNAILLWFGKLSSEAYTTIVLATTAVYIGANTAQKIKGKGDGDSK